MVHETEWGDIKQYKYALLKWDNEKDIMNERKENVVIF